MYTAYSRTHHSQRRQEQLQVLRIPHHYREGHSSYLLSTACANCRRSSGAYSWPSTRCAPGLRKPVQEVDRPVHFGVAPSEYRRIFVHHFQFLMYPSLGCHAPIKIIL